MNASQSQLAALFGVSLRTITTWAAEGAPLRGAAGYRVSEWIQWRIDKAIHSIAVDETKAEAERRLALAKAAREEIRLARDRDLFISTAEAERRLAAVVSIFLRACERGPVEIATAAAGKTIPEMVEVARDWFDGMRAALVGEPRNDPARLLEKDGAAGDRPAGPARAPKSDGGSDRVAVKKVRRRGAPHHVRLQGSEPGGSGNHDPDGIPEDPDRVRAVG
ncbi:MAG: hypothetical protein IPK83_24220 [Planctomycetes bacterium]|nr:hypothetical protein [Planctomycetota bacterium]